MALYAPGDMVRETSLGIRKYYIIIKHESRVFENYHVYIVFSLEAKRLVRKTLIKDSCTYYRKVA